MRKKSMLQKRVWCELPDALLERMLPLLPVSSLLKFRCVCKSWNSFILSSDFLQLCASSSPAAAPANGNSGHDHSISSYLLLSTWSPQYPLLAFSPSRQTWHLPSLEFLCKSSKLQPLHDGTVSLVAAAGGLLCFSDGERKLIVCNPITKAKREIECKIEEGGEEESLMSLAMASMRYDEGKRGFQLLAVGDGERGTQATYVYDSTRHMWRGCRKQRESYFFESSGVFMGKEFFILNSFPMKLLAFNTETATWRDHESRLPADVRHPCLVNSGGKLLLVAAMEDGGGEEELVGYTVWEMEGSSVQEGEGQRWSEMARMPSDMFEKIAGGNEGFDGLSCVAQGELIYLTSSEGCLVHDISQASWAWLPHSPILSDLFACIKDVYSMEPSLELLS